MDNKTLIIILIVVVLGVVAYLIFNKKEAPVQPKPIQTGGGTSFDLNNGLDLVTTIVGLFGNNSNDNTTTGDELEDDNFGYTDDFDWGDMAV